MTITNFTYKWAATWQNQQSDCAPSKDSDQPGHPRSLIRVFTVCMKKAWVLSTAKTLIRLDGCPGWSESSLGAHLFCWFCHVVAQIPVRLREAVSAYSFCSSWSSDKTSQHESVICKCRPLRASDGVNFYLSIYRPASACKTRSWSSNNQHTAIFTLIGGIFVKALYAKISSWDRLRQCDHRCITGILFFRHIHINIFTLPNNFLRWTYFGPTKFIHPWTTHVHAMLRVNNVIDECNSWLADVKFHWRQVIVAAVERKNQTRQIITFLHRLFARFKSKFNK